MKPRIYILSILFVVAMLFTLQVRADNNNNTSSALPIDSGIVFFSVAGTAIGVFAVKKSRAAAKITAIKS